LISTPVQAVKLYSVDLSLRFAKISMSGGGVAAHRAALYRTVRGDLVYSNRMF
jgi:hypothetical protein